MIRKDLLEEALSEYEEHFNLDFKPMRYNRKRFYSLFRKYKKYGYIKNFYWFFGEEKLCWLEQYEKSVKKNLTLGKIKSSLNKLMVWNKHHGILDNDKNDTPRMYICEHKDGIDIYIYARDTKIQTDFKIWFRN